MHSFSVICWFLFSIFTLQLFLIVPQANCVMGNEVVAEIEDAKSVEKAAFLDVEEMVPVMEPGKEIGVMLNESRRKLGSFQICALCTCCGSGAKAGLCLPTPCCYAINCNIPNKPFGFCSFTPQACNCFGCQI